MSAKKFLEVLEESGVLDESVLNDVRRQLKETKGKVTVESIAKFLVQKGHLTKFQATKLVGQVVEDDEDPAAAKPSKGKGKKPPVEDDLLGLAPLDEAEPTPAPASGPSKSRMPEPELEPLEPFEEEVVLLEDAGGLTPVEDAGAGLTPVGPAGGAMMLESQPLDPFGGSNMGGLSDAGAADPFAAGAAGPTGGEQPYVSKKKAQAWDTKLILGGSLTLLILFIVGGFLLWSFLAVPALEMYEAAEKSYREQAYADAKGKYENFLSSYPKDENASKARVRIFLIRIRQDAGDPNRGLTTAKEVIPEVLKEKDAEMAREEFPGLLPQIPEELVGRAKQAKDTKSREEFLAKAKEAMEIVNDPEVIPTSRRNPILPQLNRINEDIGVIERTINQERELATAITSIDSAVGAGETLKAFQVYHGLLKEYPSLRDDPGLREAVLKISVRERSLVKVVPENISPAPPEEPRPGTYRVILASRTGGANADPKNPVMTVLAGGSVYGLDASAGQVLWSRFVGHSARANPIYTSNQPDSDVLVVDAQRQELVRLKARTGDVVWRFPFGEDFAEPAVAGNRVYVATVGGRIVELDAETGESTRHVVIPQKLTVAPAVAADQAFIFQIGEHSNVYVLSADTLECQDVVYLGHRAATIEVAPLILMRHVFIAENSGAGARIHCLKIRTEGEGAKLFPTQDPLLMNGRVVVPLVVYSRRLLAVSDRGEIRVFDIDMTKNENSVTDTGRLPATQSQPIIGYPLADGTTLWIADDKLTKYTVQVTRKEITRDPTITAVGDTFVAPLRMFGNSLVHTRRIGGSTGVTVAAVNVDNPRQVIWQTHLGVPAGRIAVNPSTNEIVAISSGAALYQINGEVLKSGYNDKPLVTAGASTNLSFTQPIEFGNDVVAFFNPADNSQLLVYDPAASAARLRIVPLQIAGAKVTCTPVPFQGGLLAPADNGQVFLLKLADGSNQVLPFQPKLAPGEKVNWRQPCVIADGKEFIIADDQRNLYRIGIKDQPAPHLAELGTSRLDMELASGLAAAGDTLYGYVRSTGGDSVVAISSAELKAGKEFDLKGGRVTWGPCRVGDTVMVVTDEKELRCFGPGEKELWEKPATMHGQPAGMPLTDNGDYVFASVTGSVWRISSGNGEEVAKAELGEPLGAGPIAFKGRLLLCGNDGSLHVITMPTAAASGG